MSPCSSSAISASAWPDGRQEDVAARLVGLGLQGDAQVVALDLMYPATVSIPSL